MVAEPRVEHEGHPTHADRRNVVRPAWKLFANQWYVTLFARKPTGASNYPARMPPMETLRTEVAEIGYLESGPTANNWNPWRAKFCPTCAGVKSWAGINLVEKSGKSGECYRPCTRFGWGHITRC